MSTKEQRAIDRQESQAAADSHAERASGFRRALRDEKDPARQEFIKAQLIHEEAQTKLYREHLTGLDD